MRVLRLISFMLFAATVAVSQPTLHAYSCPEGCQCQVNDNPECNQAGYFVAHCDQIFECQEVHPGWCSDQGFECFEFCDDLGSFPWTTFCQETGDCQFSCYCIPNAC